MPFRKVPETEGELPRKVCRHPEHEPPTMRVLEPGAYEWTCPACGAVRTVRVPRGPSWCGAEGGAEAVQAIYVGPHAAGKCDR